ncbi:branched-chain amino acid transport system substrate-binding protein [Rhizobium sp. ERR 922]|uniref:ABC transporter substrate-binding protein n=1 Tax=unclassified Rhizobium TaxID=2613769 RepID=UPI00119D30CC|nr:MULTISPECIES: ABC transporter substrate-binding protein [unclassified Rhizobium]TWB53116.1 branched-chain amino acid transport system substrate-binding protein [Rhizobium sp. ERR 922]TWB95919.1 branched-chain amino acid transport system substrate-binding protein [Rhizobium sp. ERR 942]
MATVSRSTTINRRNFLRAAAAGGAAVALGGVNSFAIAAPKPIKIGFVVPQTGPLALFSEHVPFVLKQIEKHFGGQLAIGGTKVPFEILVRDSQSKASRASEVAGELILKDQVSVIMATSTPETTNPVADQAEVNGVPCITTDTPWEPHFFARGGDPKTGFEWTNHFFFGVNQVANTYIGIWDRFDTNKKVGVLWPNDGDGNAVAGIFPKVYGAKGYQIVDPGRFDMPVGSFASQISQFKANDVQVINGLLPPPEFATFWAEAAQQNFKPKVVSVGKATEFPPAIEPLGDRALGLSVPVFWSPEFPFQSGLTGQSARELAAEYEQESGRQWSMTLGFKHAIFEVLFNVLSKVPDPYSTESLRDTIRQTKYQSVAGLVDFQRPGLPPGISTTPLAGGQWQKGKSHPFDLVLIDNADEPAIKPSAAPIALG